MGKKRKRVVVVTESSASKEEGVSVKKQKKQKEEHAADDVNQNEEDKTRNTESEKELQDTAEPSQELMELVRDQAEEQTHSLFTPSNEGESRKTEAQLAKPRKGAEERIINSKLRIPVHEMPGLSPRIAENIRNNFGFEEFFPVQSEVIPAILQGIASGGRFVDVYDTALLWSLLLFNLSVGAD